MDNKYVLVKFLLGGKYKWRAVPVLWTNFNRNEFRWPACGYVALHVVLEMDNSPETHDCNWFIYRFKEHSAGHFDLAHNPFGIADILDKMFDIVGKHDVILELNMYKSMIKQLAKNSQSMKEELEWCKNFNLPRLKNMIPIKTLGDFVYLEDKLRNTYWANFAFDNLMKILTVDKDHLKESIIKILFAVFSRSLDYGNKEEQFREEFTRSRVFQKLKQHINTLDSSYHTEQSIIDVFVSRVLVRDRNYSAL